MPQRGAPVPGTEKPQGGPGGGRGRGKKGKRGEFGGRREEQELNVSKAISQRRGARDKRKQERALMKELGKDVKSEIIEVGKEGMSVADLAEALAINDSEVIKILFLKGVISTVNQTLDFETVKMVCDEEEVEVLDRDVRPSPALHTACAGHSILDYTLRAGAACRCAAGRAPGCDRAQGS